MFLIGRPGDLECDVLAAGKQVEYLVPLTRRGRIWCASILRAL